MSPRRRPRDTPDHSAGWHAGGDDGARAGDGGELAVPEAVRLEDELRAEIQYAARTRRVPLTMSAVTAGVGAGAWGAVQAVSFVGGPDAAGAAGLVVCATTALAVPVVRATLRERIADEWLRRWWFSTTCAAVWVDVVATRGPDLLTPGTGIGVAAALVLGSAALGARWAEEHDVDRPDDDPVPEPTTAPLPIPAAPDAPVVDTSEADDIEAAWAARVAAGQNPVAAGSVLTGVEKLPHGWRWVIELDPDGSVGCTALETEGTDAQVALKLVRRHTHVMVERHEDDPGEHLAMLTVVTRDVLSGGVAYDGPRYERGVVGLGQYADGTGHAVWHAYDPTGVLCGLVTGGQGSGKSALMAALGMAYRASGEWTVLFGDGDPQGGSSRLLGEVAHDFARGPHEVLEQLEGLEALAQVRGHLMGTLTDGPDGKPTPITRAGQRPVDKILPCPQFPGVVWFLDEFHKLANDPDLQAVDFVGRVAKLVRLLRKYGGAFVIGTQSALGDDFDGDSAFRAMIAGGNTIALRSKNKSEQGIVTDGLSPHLLPKGGGYALQGDGPRRAMIRCAWSPDMDRWVPQVVRAGQPDARSWAAFRRYRVVRELDPAADYAERMSELAAIDAAIETGAPLPWTAEARAEAGEEPADVSSAGGFAIPMLTGNVIPIRPAVEPEPAPPAEPLAPPRLTHSQRVVHADLEQHPGGQRTAAIVDRTQLPAPTVSKALGVLVKHGLAHRPSGVRGVHAAGPEPVQDREQGVI